MRKSWIGCNGSSANLSEMFIGNTIPIIVTQSACLVSLCIYSHSMLRTHITCRQTRGRFRLKADSRCPTIPLMSGHESVRGLLCLTYSHARWPTLPNSVLPLLCILITTCTSYPLCSDQEKASCFSSLCETYGLMLFYLFVIANSMKAKAWYILFFHAI